MLLKESFLLFVYVNFLLISFCLSKEFQQDPMPGCTAETLCPFTGILSVDLNTVFSDCLFTIFFLEHLHSIDDLKFKQLFIITLNKTTFLFHSQVKLVIRLHVCFIPFISDTMPCSQQRHQMNLHVRL